MSNARTRLPAPPGRPAFAGRVLLAGAAAIGLVLAIATAYHALDVRRASRDTADLVAAAHREFGTELSMASLSPVREAVLLRVEDPAFRRHRGVDLATPGAGMTTLTQGLVKQLYFPDGFRPGFAKIRQTLIAQYAFDARVSKDEQLELVLNAAYLGHHEGRPVHGFASAARTYYGKEFSDLGDDEFLGLVAMLIAPNALKPGTPAHRERVERIQRYLRGEYRPRGVMDVEYAGTDPSPGVAERGLMALLRLVTDARPAAP